MMSISCMRCQRRATSLLTYDHARAETYLDDARGDEQRFEGMMLCEDHAHRFTSPRGWTAIDRRRPATLDLFDACEVG